MSMTTHVLILYSVILFALLLIIPLLGKVRRLEKKLVDVDPKDLYPFIEEMRELLVESERVADALEDSLREKESTLEDLNAIIDGKLERYQQIIYKSPDEKPLRNKIAEMHDSGMSAAEISRKLQISLTEVNIVLSTTGD